MTLAQYAEIVQQAVRGFEMNSVGLIGLHSEQSRTTAEEKAQAPL